MQQTNSDEDFSMIPQGVTGDATPPSDSAASKEIELALSPSNTPVRLLQSAQAAHFQSTLCGNLDGSIYILHNISYICHNSRSTRRLVATSGRNIRVNEV